MEQDLNLEINIDNMTLGDLEMMMILQEEENPDIRQLVKFLDHVVVNMDARDIPLSQLKDVFSAVSDAINQTAAPKD